MSKQQQSEALKLEMQAFLAGSGKYAAKGPGAITVAINAAYPEGLAPNRKRLSAKSFTRFSLKDYWQARIA